MVGKVRKRLFPEKLRPIKKVPRMATTGFHRLNRFRLKRCHNVWLIDPQGLAVHHLDYRVAAWPVAICCWVGRSGSLVTAKFGWNPSTISTIFWAAAAALKISRLSFLSGSNQLLM